MFNKIGLVTVLIAGLAACSSDPVTVESATDSKSASTVSTHPTPTMSTEPITTTPPSSVAPTTAPATTAPPTSAPEVATSPPPATAPIGDLEVLTATGVGDPLSEPALIEQLDSLGFTADAPGNYAYYANPTPHPFVNIENGRLMYISVHRGVRESYSYTFAVDLPADQTLKATATAAAAPLVAKFPDGEAETKVIEPGGEEAFAIELKATEDDFGYWSVEATASAEYPTVVLVSVGYSTYNLGPDAGTPEAPTGLTLVSAPFQTKVESTLEQANLPSANLSSYWNTTGLKQISTELTLENLLQLEVELPDQDYTAAAQNLTGLADHGWILSDLDDPAERVEYGKDGDRVSLFRSDDPERPTTVRISLNRQ